jgi:hypothetical protein
MSQARTNSLLMPGPARDLGEAGFGEADEGIAQDLESLLFSLRPAIARVCRLRRPSFGKAAVYCYLARNWPSALSQFSMW